MDFLLMIPPLLLSSQTVMHQFSPLAEGAIFCDDTRQKFWRFMAKLMGIFEKVRRQGDEKNSEIWFSS